MAKITNRTVESVTVPNRGDYFIWDEDMPGFGVRILASGRKSYLVQYKKDGRNRRVTLGLHGRITPAEARQLAKQVFGDLARGHNPAEERAIIRRDPTIHELCDLYLKEGRAAKPTKKESSWRTDASNMARHIRPLLGTRKLRSVTKADIQRFQSDVCVGKTATDERTGFRGRAIVKGGPGTAARATAILGAMLSFAVDRGLLPSNPARGVKLHPTKRRERFLSADEMARLGEALAEAELKAEAAPSVAAIRLLILTGCRKGEIATLQWRFIDQERCLLQLPDSKTGAKVVPIGGPAMDVLKAQPRFPNEPYVFPSPRQGRHLVGLQKVWERVRDAAKLENVRLHDLRHSFASVAVTGGHSLYMVSKILGHKDTRTTEIYAHLAADPMRDVANQTASLIADMLKARPKPVLEAAE